jgi:AcrR family transcriptional regulator
MGRVTDPRARVLAAIQSSAVPSRRDGDGDVPLGRKAARTRAALLDAARLLFADQGYTATSVGDIAAAAGVSLGAFYQYFRDRADIMAALVGDGARRMLDDAEHVWRPSEGRAGVRRMIAAFVGHYRSTAKFQRVWEEVTHIESDLGALRREIERVFVSGTEAAIRQGQHEGSITSTLDPAGVATALSAMVDRTCYVTFVVDRSSRRNVDAVVDVLTGIWCAALGIDDVGAGAD